MHVPGLEGDRRASRTVVRPRLPASVSRFVYFFVTLIPLISSYAVDFGARQTNQS